MTCKNIRYCATGLALLLYTSLVAADILDGAEVRFHGRVTDEGPRWTWQVASADQTWGVDTADAKIMANRLVFDLSSKGALPFLEGRLYKVADSGGPGFSPVVTFSSQGQSLLLPKGGDTSRGSFRAAIPVINPANGEVTGSLAFTLEQGLAAAFGPPSGANAVSTGAPGMSLLTGGTVTQLPPDGLSGGLMNRLSTLLLMTRGWGTGMSAVSNGQVLHQSVLSAGNVTNIAAAYASSLSDFQLTLPADDTPAFWQARLGVTVTVQ
ncbi:fimbrial protein [Salmonella enterica]|nr:fimbrial protein [Salmonella enterica]